MLNTRGATLQLARRRGARQARRACRGHASQRARRDAVVQVLQGALPPGSPVGSAHTRLAIELRAFGLAERAWGHPAACAQARRTEGAPRLRGSRLATGEARRGRAGPPGGIAPWTPVPGAACPEPRWAVPKPGSRLSCAPSVILNTRGATLQLARRHGAQRARRACGGHGAQKAHRDAVVQVPQGALPPGSPEPGLPAPNPGETCGTDKHMTPSPPHGRRSLSSLRRPPQEVAASLN